MTFYPLTHVLSFGVASGLSILFLMLLFRPLEWAFPARKGQLFFRQAWLMDLSFFLGQYLLWNGLVLLGLHYIKQWLDPLLSGTFRTDVAAQPWLLQAAEVVLLSDLLIYWAHRLQHSVEFLWRFHKVHHSAEQLDWLAAHREHPLDSIYTVGLINLPAIVLGFPLETISAFVAFRGIWAIYIHANVRFTIGPLRWFIGAPELHHWHHAKDRDAGNYANLSPLMDILFGTYVCPAHEPANVGIRESLPRSYFGQLVYPLLPERLGRKWFRLSEQDNEDSDAAGETG